MFYVALVALFALVLYGMARRKRQKLGLLAGSIVAWAATIAVVVVASLAVGSPQISDALLRFWPVTLSIVGIGLIKPLYWLNRLRLRVAGARAMTRILAQQGMTYDEFAASRTDPQVIARETKEEYELIQRIRASSEPIGLWPPKAGHFQYHTITEDGCVVPKSL